MSTTSNLTQDPGYFTRYKNFALGRSASGVLTLRFHTDGGPHTFDGTTHHDFPRLLDYIAFDTDSNRVLVLTGTGDSFITNIDGPSLGDLTKPVAADVLYTEGRRGLQRLADLEIPIIAAVNGPATVHSHTTCSPRRHRERHRRVHACPTWPSPSPPATACLWSWASPRLRTGPATWRSPRDRSPPRSPSRCGAVAKVVPLDQVLPRAQELAEQMTQRPQPDQQVHRRGLPPAHQPPSGRGHADRDGPGKPDRREPRLPPQG